MTTARQHAVILSLSLLTLLPLAACVPVHDPTAIREASPTADPPRKKPETDSRRTGPAKSTPAKSRPQPGPTSTARDPLWGAQYAYLSKADVKNRRLSFDLVEWHRGKAAARACRQDRVKPEADNECTRWYIRNKNTKLRTLTVYPDAPIRIYGDKSELVPASLAKFIDDIGPYGLFRFDVDGWRIMRLEPVAIP